jgi:hypothetical protein
MSYFWTVSIVLFIFNLLIGLRILSPSSDGTYRVGLHGQSWNLAGDTESSLWNGSE